MSRVGETIAGKYRIIAPIGAGGMGAVYAARHVQLDTPLALKFLAENSKGSVERFLREAKACAALKSEHVCRVSDFGIDGDTPYIAMELMEGEDLASVLRGGKLSTATAADYVIQACMGIAEAHSLGIVHRDLKPGNLFLTKRPDGSPLIKVLDFGVAKVPIFNSVSLTQTASVIGSPAYMSPEQVRSSRSVDGRSDVWALGVILYELVSDRHPFKGKSLTDLAVAIAMDPPAPLDEAPELEGIIARALEKDPNRRFVDVASFAGALEKFSFKHADSGDVASRILYGSVERPTVPRSVAQYSGQHTVDEGPPTVEDAGNTASTTMQRSTGEQVSRAKTRWGISLGLAALLVGAGAVVFFVTRPDADAVDATADLAPPPAPLPKPPETPTKGRVIITVTGTDDAMISIDGRERGRGVRVVDELDVGPHAIELRVGDRDPIKQPVEIQAGMISTVAIVVPAAPTAPPVVAVVAKEAPPIVAAPVRVKPSNKVAKATKPRNDLLQPKPGATVATATPPPEDDLMQPAQPNLEPPLPQLPGCALVDRLPSGKCPEKSVGQLPERLYQNDFLAGVRGVWGSVLRCRGTDVTTGGRVLLKIVVDQNGRADATVLQAFDAVTGTCVAATIETATFRVTSRGGTVTYPIDL